MLRENLELVENNILEACRRSGRDRSEVTLIAVSKTKPVSMLREAYDLGIRTFGENKVQELTDKYEVLPHDIEWHLIGHLQSNKADRAVELADCIHSVDSVKLLNKIAAAAEKRGKVQDLLLEVNVSGEESKFGLSGYDALREAAEHALGLTAVRLLGLMTMAPLDAEKSVLHATFGGLRNFRDRLEQEFSVRLPELSMGMSSDYPEAIAEGATIVRIGTAIFGGRS